MTPATFPTYADIDWNLLWKNSRNQKSWRSKNATEWDKKANSFSSRSKKSKYVPSILERLPLGPDVSILDIGCGPGTLALPLSSKVRSVTAFDYSQQMIALLDDQIREQRITNIRSLCCSWEDDWETFAIEPADIAIASRSMSVPDLHAALQKINRYSRRYVFITDRIAPGPFDPEAFIALGRDFQSGPDYIYTVNMLYSMHIHPNIEVLELEGDITYDNLDEVYTSYRWMFHDISKSEEQQLHQYLKDHLTRDKETGTYTLHRSHPVRWALIWWKK